ncbi:MAG TPA: CAP domain-containing protein, partial [Kofleriaceae bacterium]|nr:CAP domain-containing protein [Kofleriaceae bacterium]
GAAFKTRVPCDRHRGKQQLEITATGAQGSTVLANFPVWCGAEPPRSMTIDVTADDGAPVTPDDAERRLLALANRDRAAAGLPGLIWDDRIAAVARKYSEEMRTTKIVAHVSAISGSVVDRLKAAGITSSVVLENVARDYSVVGAHEGLMNSPGHRANLLSATATHIGIGVAYGDEVAGRREMFLTQVFIRIPPKVDPGRASDLVRQRIEAVRRVGVDPTLSAIAQTVADGLASGKSRDDLWPAARKRLDAGPGDYARVGSAVLAVADLDSVDAKDLLSGYKPDAIGIGIAQGNHPEIGEGAIWIVVLMAERPTKP